ncbi:MAG TPA: 4Fe-4S dicluster domain-containing protein [Phycisphaerae bacterium]|nr:4Fe-4S dicluster domain-containing protein [Phycisphaerae bacterium]HOB75813.1 4Fe-4S dicluster domain-containing protein [Phycisphaerae bacterium]HOJ54560.1 4Fe-4S dicluster domain-containing protein [Phycisphaerae bacterium]HOL27047.1 4Fe-4S dicluster domain-containing protein [Phycisphaerae bacterium]HPP22155.1 4Fe-4S dicluster domain-containing protein [Phycisphaerae bacterium]
MAEELDNTPRDRRAMFRLGLKRLMEPVAQFLEERLQIPLPIPRTVLRPPGAQPEREFLAACYRCGNCVDVCPARAIRSLSNDDIEQRGTPYIDPDLAACVVCDELACMKACPSGALRPVNKPTDIRMGLARVKLDLCLRSRDEDCRICVAKCPIGPTAITINPAGQIEILPQGCVGCGACQFYCPTTPKAITIEPHF